MNRSEIEPGAATAAGSGCCCPGAVRLPDADRIRAWWDLQRERFPGFELVPHIQRLLVEGEPVALEQLAEAASWQVKDVEAALLQHPGVDWDGQGRLVGFGLTLRPTPHRFTFDGRTVYGFCASDALQFPVVLGRPGVVESTCPATGRSIRVEVTPERVERVDPPSAMVSLVRPATFDDIRSAGCDLGHFYASPEAAAAWQAAYGGTVHSVEEEFLQTRQMMERVGWAANGGGGDGR